MGLTYDDLKELIDGMRPKDQVEYAAKVLRESLDHGVGEATPDEFSAVIGGLKFIARRIGGNNYALFYAPDYPVNFIDITVSIERPEEE